MQLVTRRLGERFWEMPPSMTLRVSDLLGSRMCAKPYFSTGWSKTVVFPTVLAQPGIKNLCFHKIFETVPYGRASELGRGSCGNRTGHGPARAHLPYAPDPEAL